MKKHNFHTGSAMAPEANREKILLSLPHMSGKEQEFIADAFKSNWIVPLGPCVDAFEKALKEYLGDGNEVVALSAGTAAIHLGLVQLGVGPGDEVICQDFTFAASANPVVYQGATPVFVDSEKDTWNMSPELLEEAINDRIRVTGKKPKAIIPVDLYGMPAKMNEIVEIARRYDIPVLEDSAEALGSEINGKKCGTFGDFGVFSFNGNKVITTSGGGALICNSPEVAQRTKYYATQAREAVVYYLHKNVGYNYRLSNICAAIGCGQMTVLEQRLARRREIHAIYADRLDKIPGISVADNPSKEYNSNFWLTCILIDKKVTGYSWEDVYEVLKSNDIETRPLWKPMHQQPVFANNPFYGNGFSDYLFESGLCLPSGSSMSDDDVNRVIEIIENLNKK